MKKRSLYIIFLLFLGSATMLQARERISHWMGVWAELGEWSMLPEQSRLNPSIGGAGALGGTYEMQVSHFLLNVGLGAKAGYTSFKTPDDLTWYLEPGNHLYGTGPRDRDGWYYDYYAAMDNRRDNYLNVSFQIPVLLGAQFGRFYFLAGVKGDIHMLNRATISGDVRSHGEYEEFRMPLPGGGYTGYITEPYDMFYHGEHMKWTQDDVLMRVNVNASLEIGARLGYIPQGTGFDVPKSKVQYRIAAFADFGLMDMHRADTRNGLELPELKTPAENYIQRPELMISHILSTNDIAKRVRNLYVGVKFTVLFEIPAPKRCLLCPDSYIKFSPTRPNRGGTRLERDE